MTAIREIDAATCAGFLRDAEKVVALTGAGVSTAAGIPDFRGPRGLYVTRRYDPEKTFDIDAFRRDPAPFFEFTRDLLGLIESIRPTFTHEFLARLEEEGRLTGVVTQNIDPLHEMAGTKNLIAVHGNYWTSHCTRCGRAYPYDAMVKKIESEPVPRCACGAVIKPDVVFFGEAVRDLDRGQALVAASDVLLVLGTSLAVYPAAFLPESAPGRVVAVNKGPVALRPGPERYLAQEDLDGFFRAVAAEMGMA